jgi:hypothetical protein
MKIKEIVERQVGFMPDSVTHPMHYTSGEVECIDAIRSALGAEGFVSYCHGNALKYIWRAQHHERGAKESVKKAVWYLRSSIEDDPRKEKSR